MYWDNREEKNVTVVERLSENDLFLSLATIFYPFRKGNEHFVRKILKKIKPGRVLDIACGIGKAVIPRSSNYVIGIDIKGYPKQHAAKLGYKELLTYNFPEYKISINKELDAITMINLNAHISFDNFKTILHNALKYLRSGGSIIFIFEFDNDSFEYRLLKKNSEKFRKMVANMQHDFFEYENIFINKLEAEFSDLLRVERTSVCSAIPLLHFYGYQFNKNKNYFEKSPGKFFNLLSYIIELPIGLFDSFIRMFSKEKINLLSWVIIIYISLHKILKCFLLKVIYIY